MTHKKAESSLGMERKGPYLLVDTGAFRNLAGSTWITQVEKALQKAGQPPIKWHKLPHPHPVSGVGNDEVCAYWQAEVPVTLPDGGRISYTCHYLADSECPALLGVISLKDTGTILGSRKGKMHMYTGDTSQVHIECKHGNGVSKMNLEQAPGGHILLPCRRYVIPMHS